MSTVLITGASRGIGRAISTHLVEQGWTVYAGVRDVADAPPGTTPVELDVTDATQIARLAERLPASLDAVVNNAGIVVAGPVESLTPESLRRQLEVNVVAQVAITTAVLPLLRAAGGRIIYMTSLSGRLSTPMTGAYNASKFALEAIADAQRVELRPWGIPVTCIEPGPIDTDPWRTADDLIEENRAGMSSAMQTLYGPHLAGLASTIGFVQRTASPVETVVRTVDVALRARRPRARYTVGASAKVQLVAAALTPTILFDRVSARIAGIPARIG
ncbi:SDR family NAD(P)-dependent oxidoreductase [Gordonia desulfuricans]|uniref:SDR family NAD(P)-dependent oxidoreductase n=1 Tax=Gordonia desulfuricans TaxID=89051 RepID=A0A7K3LQ26_9ACTN|nr:SDR family NAD(P)-dependent oxidoreductase [Gordonia desulfuricans]NDK90345.1 SDR family NAD(P)-dependent oxidoreductase [Gordonia desulfuricans]